MFIVHAGWTSWEGTQYAIAGIFEKKGPANDAAMELAESMMDDSDDWVIKKNGIGVLVIDTASGGEIQIQIDRIKLNEKAGHLFGQISTG